MNFASAHPNHTFSGTVYAQCLRLRRIINDQDRLDMRLNELATVFTGAGYPSKMVDEIKSKVLNSERDISIKERPSLDTDQIRVVSTFRADEDIVKCVKDSEESFKQTPSFRNLPGKLFAFVKKVGPNIK